MANRWSPSPVDVLKGTPLTALMRSTDKPDIRSTNVMIKKKHLDLVDEMCTKLKTVKPTAVCCICAKILYPHQIKWVAHFSEDEWRAASLIPEISPVRIETKLFPRKGRSVSTCACCESNIKSGRYKVFDYFDKFGNIPDCFKQVKSYAQFRKLSIANLYCSTYTNPGYSYLHARGEVSFSLNSPKNFGGMIGMLQSGDEVQLETSNQQIKKCLLWMKQNNFLYKKFLSSLETIHGYAETKSSGGLFCGLPEKTKNMHIQDDGPVPARHLEKQAGLLFPSENIKAPKEPIDIANVPIGKQVTLEPSTKKKENKEGNPYAKVESVTYSDPNLEAKIFPQLFPHGLGSWSHPESRVTGLTIGAYHKVRILHADRRWANDRCYPFFAFDRNMKDRICYINNILGTNKNRDAPITSGDLTQSQSVYKYGKIMNATVIGSKAYWQKQYLDLVARVSAHGPGDIFFTVTFNESWPELKEILGQYKSKASVHHPVEPTVYFFERYNAVKDLIEGENSVFGEVEHSWHRVESQNRGALHIHGILWLKEGTFDPDSIVAEMPRGQDEKTIELRELVKKLQVHACRPNRCFRTWNGKTTDKCKYGFPFNLRDSDGYSAEGLKYEYKRTQKEDTTIVPYNPSLLLAWRGHINVQKITNTGLERYLVKYVSKVEPSFTIDVENEYEVSKYLQSRLIGAPEAVAMLLSYPMTKSDTSVLFLDTNMQNERSRPLKRKKELERLEPESTDVFVPGAREHYSNRPQDEKFENMTYPQYTCQFNLRKEKLKTKEVPVDLDGNYVCPKQSFPIPRYRFLDPTDGELFYYQLLLLKVPFRNECDLISPDNESKTYKEECYIRELFNEQDELDISFHEMKRRNFDPQRIAKIARKMLLEEISDKETLSTKIIGLDYAENIPFEGENLDVYETTAMINIDSDDAPEIQRLLQINKAKLLREKNDLKTRVSQLTDSQTKVYNHISMNQSSQILAFVTGPGGTGKSFLLHTIKLLLEFSANMVEVLATSGNAAQLIGGQTVHSFFKLTPDLENHFSYRDMTWSAISATDVLIIDEVSMMSGELLETIDLICREVATEDCKAKAFGGKTVIMFGDLHQLPAVMSPPAYRQIYQSPVWSQFKPFFLDQNCRQKDDIPFQHFLNRVRIGQQTQNDIDILESRLCGKGHDISDACRNIHDNESFVICSKHIDREKVNQTLQEETLIDQPLHQLRSRDYDASGNPLCSAHSNIIDAMKGSLPRQVTVRINAKVMITRNLDVNGGVVNGTTGILRRVHKKFLMIEKLDGSDLIPVQKVKQRMIVTGVGITAYRVQYPIILAWACTVHRMQGLTVEKAHVKLDDSFFAAGQAYVALSRVKCLESIHLLSFNPKCLLFSKVVSDIMDHARKTGKLKCVPKVKGKENAVHNKMSNQSFEEAGIPKRKADGTELFEGHPVKRTKVSETEYHTSTSNGPIEGICRQTFRLRTEVNFNFFNPTVQEHEIQNCFNTYKPVFQRFLHFVRSVQPAIATESVSIDLHVGSTLHPAMMSEYVPVITTGDGNCLWNSVSISMFGNERMKLTLRFLTVYIMWEYKEYFLEVIRNDTIRDGNPNDSFHKQLRIARNDREWGNEFHLLALSIVLQRNIFSYSSFSSENGRWFVSKKSTPQNLANAFRTRRRGTGGQLIFCPPPLLQLHSYNQTPICIHFDARRRHYTAVLPQKVNALQFRPYTNLFA